MVLSLLKVSSGTSDEFLWSFMLTLTILTGPCFSFFLATQCPTQTLSSAFDGSFVVCPVPEIGGDIPKAASLVRPPLPTAGSPAAFAAWSSQGPNYKAPPAALGPPPLPSVYVTGCGTVYHLKNTCGKLKCARRNFERTACDQCGSLAFNGGRNIWLVHGRYHLELHGNLTVSNTTTWAPCFECGGGWDGKGELRAGCLKETRGSAVTLQICDPVALRFCKALPGQCVGSRRLKLRLPRKTTRCHWDATLVVGAHNIGTQL